MLEAHAFQATLLVRHHVPLNSNSNLHIMEQVCMADFRASNHLQRSQAHVVHCIVFNGHLRRLHSLHNIQNSLFSHRDARPYDSPPPV